MNRWAWLLLLLCSCQRLQSCRERPLAELTGARGEVSRDYRGREQIWNKAEVGSAFSFGDALRTARGSLAEVRVGRTGRLQVESETIVRFLPHVGPDNTNLSELQVAQGSAVIESGADGLTLRTRSGTAVLDPDSKIELHRAADADSYRVLMGGATFHQDDGQTLTVGAGHTLAVGIGKAVFDDDDAAKPPQLTAAVALEPDVVAPVEEPSAKVPTVQDAARATAAELAAPAGESFVIYDPAPPTQIALLVPKRCEQGAELKLQRGPSVRGATRLALDLDAGSYRYTVYCLDAGKRGKPAANGVIEVQKANGTRALPKSAPHNAVELDGHSYRLVYQNLRPEVSVSWPNAPKAASYNLLIRPASGAMRRVALTRPEHLLRSGALSDGKHELVMEASGGKARSKATTVDITYDDSAPTANLELPAASGFVAGEPLEIRGIAAEGTSVSVDGEQLEPNAHGSFRRTLTLAPGRTAVSVRFQHRTHRVRYYVRRARPTAP
ncbi:MAG TPA: hypothetical protein VFN67_04955 [Polyangiales bacterium]|nr:hypothetical protein [Polyangiales bacterium]